MAESDTWRPKLKGTPLDWSKLSLSAAQGFLLSRIDGATSVRELAQLTQQTPAQVAEALQQLAAAGVLEAGPGTAPEAPPHSNTSATTPSPTAEPGAEPLPSATQAPHAVEPAEDSTAAPGDEAAEDDSPLELDDDDQVATPETGRALFEAELSRRELAERESLATTAEEPLLSALCFDPAPSVIRNLVAHPRFAPPHARLVARHHRTPQGLDALVAKPGLTRDGGVRRALLQNPQLSEAQLKRLVGGRRPLELYRLCTHRDYPERTRTGASRLLRARFATAAAEERVELILKTEGRALAGLSGIPVDGRTASLLCAHSYSSSLLIQNLARWSAAPPMLLSHLLRQPVVKRQPQLRAVLVRHPNLPSHEKK